MSRNPQIPTGKEFAWRLAAFYAALFVALGVQLPFLPVWLAAKGLDAADHRHRARGADDRARCSRFRWRPGSPTATTRCAAPSWSPRLAAVAGYGALGLASGTLAIAVLYALAAAFYTPLMPLADVYALRGLAQHRRAYGPVRLWGSAAFIVGSFGAGLLLDWIAARNLIWLMVAAMAAGRGRRPGRCRRSAARPRGTRRRRRRRARACCATRRSSRSPRRRA